MTDITRTISSLSSEKRALLARKLKEQGSQFNMFPLSFGQQRLWFLDQLTPGSPVYNVPAAVRLTGRLDARALEQCFDEIIRRHEILRTTFTTPVVVDGNPAQIVGRHRPFKLRSVDLSELPTDEREAQVLRLTNEESQRPFDLISGPLLRVTLYRLGAEEHVLLLVAHHIISDGWSTGVLIREISVLYPSFLQGKSSPLGDLPIQYADFARWQRERLQGERLESLIDYWKRRLDGCPPALELPADRPRPAEASFRGANQSVTLPGKLPDAIKALSHEERVTSFIALLAALQALLHRYTGEEDICVGTPIAGRNRGETEGLIGFFVNTLVIRVDLSGDPSFRELLGRVRESALGAYAHQELPFETLVEKLQPERSLSHSPFFQVAFAYQNGIAEALEMPGLTLRPVELKHKTTKFDLTMAVTETSTAMDGLNISVEYNTDIFNDDTIARLLGHYQVLLEGIIADPDQRISELPVLTEAEHNLILSEWNGAASEYPSHKCVHELFEAQVDLGPDSIALVIGEEHLTYRELNRRANQLAHYLIRLGVGPETPVGFCLERSPVMVIGILGVLKAGGTYTPLDPAYPRERLAFMLEDTRAPVVLVQDRLIEHLPERQARLVRIDGEWELIAQESEANPVSGVMAGNLAYVMYTSGSTGKPKGIAIPHRAINRLVINTNYIDITRNDRMMLASNSAFDAATFELWGALLNGARLVGISRELALSPRELAASIRDHGITAMWLTTALFNQLVREVPKAFGSVRHLLVGGEALDPRWVREALINDPPARLVNGYGPTENTTFTTWYLAQEAPEGARSIPIGRPISNTQTYLLDRNQQPTPVGVVGELYTGGDGLARGYYNRPELTAEKFIPNPFSDEPGARLYRTGDLGRYLPDGSIDFLGRLDHQVKIRGFRIELAEIEAVLTQHPAVRESAVVASEDVAGEKRLTAYVALEPGAALADGELRKFLRQKLPDYMTPSFFVELERLPLTPHGKVDRRAMPAPGSLDMARSDWAGAYVAPRTIVEEALAGIWSKVLGVARVGVHDSFFDMGGHSLLATQTLSRVREAFRIELPLRSLFEAPTVAGFAECLEVAMRATDGLQTPPIRPVSRDGRLPLSFAQQRLWFMDQLGPGNPAYNIPGAIRLSGKLDVAALERSLNEIVRRHESLRTTFATIDGQPAQIIGPYSPLTLPTIDLGDLSETEKEAQVSGLVAENALRSFDLSQGPLFCLCLLRLDETEHIVIFSMSHIISDEWSLGVLAHELAALYAAFCQDQPSPLAELPIQYADFAHWQREWLRGEALEAQLAYWRGRLGGKLPELRLPFAHPRPAAPTYRGATRSFALSPEVSASLRALSREEGATMFMTLLAALQALLSRYTGQDDIVVGTDVANRNRLETEGLIGFFVNHLVLRADLSGNPSFRRLLRQARDLTLGAYAHQDVPFDKLVSALRLDRNPGSSPLFQVLLVFGNPTLPTLELPGLTLSPLRSDLVLSKYDLTLFMNDKGQNITGVWRYSAELFETSVIARMSGQFETLLGSVAANPDTRVDSLEIFTEAERRRQDCERRERQEARAKKLRSVDRQAVWDASSAPRV